MHLGDRKPAALQGRAEFGEVGRARMTATDDHPYAVAQPIQRPDWPRLLWYWLGGSLPKPHSSWVLHDVTCRTWLLRHFARTLMLVLPLFAVYMALMPSSLGIRLLTGLTFSGGLLVLSLVLVLIETDRR